ncbi:hypothetical protein GN244_ATG05071 [Phytophthora infestans]|uniref:Uncharacterized protein n=2 Tax=Phytophthora infestans TaxID=4787 RepID=A0A833TGI7_PHYIN|nr:hypothetical protein GN244_ATG05071 [Phytophthora infestans]KAI9987591.1 hypothetical protein PInf_023632 [Phytophthora infestans]
MEKTRANEAGSVKSSFVEDEIGELRKYIVGMMHAEMELMENIKLNECNVATANARIKHFKELIAQEHARFKTLSRKLDGDTNELKSLEEEQVVAEAKHSEFRYAVAKREREVQVLRAQFQQQRAAMLSLRCQILDATTKLDKLSSTDALVEKEAQNVTAALGECAKPTKQRASRQKIRAKIRYTQQFIVQMGEETNQLIEKRAKLEAEVRKCEQETHKLRESIFLKERGTDVLFKRLRDDTHRVVKENGKIEGKLKAKRRKYRLKTKNEANSLKRRVTFITSELERGQMTNEDALSSVGALSTQREELEQRLSAQNEQLAAAEGAITELQISIATFGRNEGGFGTRSLQEELSEKRESVQTAQKKLQDKQNLLKLLETDQTQLDATLKDVGDQIVGTKDAVERLNHEIASLAKDINDQEAKTGSLRALVADAKKKSDGLQAEYQELQRKNKNAVKTKAKLRRQKDSLLKQEKELVSKAQETEHLSRVLGEGIKYGMDCVERLNESNALSDDKEKRIEFELRRQELSLQQQCAHEESQFQAEVAAWDEKIKRVERQLRSL